MLSLHEDQELTVKSTGTWESDGTALGRGCHDGGVTCTGVEAHQIAYFNLVVLFM